MATISFGPNLGLLNNAAINQKYYDQFRPLLQALDQLIMGRVINATTSAPPSAPSNGDAYLLSSGVPSGAWTGQGGNIAVWDTQVTLTGTNTLNPSWVFYTPNEGWIIWNTALAGLYVYDGTNWDSLAGGANFPTNTDITSMTGIPNTTLDTTGYTYNGGSTATTVIDATGLSWGTPSISTGTGGIYAANTTFAGTGYTGFGLAVQGSSGATTMVGGGFLGTGQINSINIANTGTLAAGTILKIGTGTAGTPGIITSFATGQALQIGPAGSTFGFQTALTFESGTTSPTSGIGLIGFGTNYATQTTVGAAGSASVIPGAPKKWIQMTDTDGSIVVMPVWAAS